MQSTDQILLSVISTQAVLIVSIVGWLARRTIRNVDRNADLINQTADMINRHLSWHDGQNGVSRDRIGRH